MKYQTNVNIDNLEVYEIVKTLAKTWNTDIQESCQEKIAAIPKDVGKGSIKGMKFPYGVSLLLMDGSLNKDLTLTVSSNKESPLCIIFCVEGATVHTIGEQETHYEMSNLLGSMSAIPASKNQTFKFPANHPFRQTIMLIDRKKYLKKIECELDLMPDALRKLFEPKHVGISFLYQSHYSIAIADCIEEIQENNYKDIVRATFMESKLLELLSLQIKQFRDDLNPSDSRKILRKFDIDKINQARNILLDNMQDPPTIPQLAKQVGTNQQKLKKGFKAIFDDTIYNYLRTQRLEKARLLLLEGSLNVQEVATHVGYINKSHFARRFKEKFGYSPKNYVKKIRATAQQ